MNIKFNLSVLLFVVLTMFITSCTVAIKPEASSDQQNDALTPITVCMSANNGNSAALHYANEMGLFADQGLVVDLIYIRGGTDATAALIAGDADLCQIGAAGVVAAIAAGADLALIGGVINTQPYAIIVTPDIEDPDGLIGKRLAVSGPGASSDTVLRASLRELGLEPDIDVEIISVGGAGERFAAMEAGAIAGTVLTPPLSISSVVNGYRNILDVSSLGIPYQHTGVVTSKSLIEDERGLAVAFMAAITNAMQQMKSDEAGSLAVLADYLFLEGDDTDAILQGTYEQVVRGYYRDEPWPTLEGIQTVIDELALEIPAAASLAPADIVDLSILEEVLGDRE